MRIMIIKKSKRERQKRNEERLPNLLVTIVHRWKEEEKEQKMSECASQGSAQISLSATVIVKN